VRPDTGRARSPVREDVGDGGLEARGDVGGLGGRQRAGRLGGDQQRDRGFQAGEREIAARPVQQRARQPVGVGRAGARAGLQRRAAWIGQAEQFRGFIKRLAGGVVQGRAEPAVPADTLDQDALRVPAREQQEQIGEGGLRMLKARQPRREGVGFEVVDREVRFVHSQSRPFGKAGADQQAADQPGARGRSDRAQIIVPEPGLAQAGGRQAGQGGKMRARGDFRHHAAECRVLRDLAQQNLGEDRAVGCEDRAGRLVAGTLDPEDRPAGAGGRRCGCFSFHAARSRARG
jgi:hypothetical protein